MGLGLKWIEKYEISFERFAMEKCDIWDIDNPWICALETSKCMEDENCNAYSCPLCYPAEEGMDGDINTVVVYREAI